MPALSDYLTTWELSDPHLLAETVTSHIYTVTSEGTRVVLKLLKPYGTEERSGAAALRCYDGQGAVRLLRDDEHAHLLEYADGDDLIPLVKAGKDEQATRIIADVLNKFYSATKDSSPDGLTSLRRWFRELFKKAEADNRTGLDSIYMRAAAVAETLLAEPREVCVLHGDIHHQNIRYHAQRGWLAFDPKGLYGERTYDTANTLCSPGSMPEFVQNEDRLLRNARILAEALGIDFTRLLNFTFVYACLSASWSLNDDQDADHALRVAEIIERNL